MPDPRVVLVGLLIAGAVYGGIAVVTAVDQGLKKVSHAIVHVLKR